MRHWPFWCPRCRSHHYAEFPPELASGFFAPRMKALVAYCKGACHMSYATIQTFLADVYTIETGSWAPASASMARTRQGPADP